MGNFEGISDVCQLIPVIAGECSVEESWAAERLPVVIALVLVDSVEEIFDNPRQSASSNHSMATPQGTFQQLPLQHSMPAIPSSLHSLVLDIQEIHSMSQISVVKGQHS
jgi:hypothetical protein